MGQALITANLCHACGGPLNYSKLTGQPCDREDPSAHYHEGERGPLCCPCLKAAGAICAQLAGADEVAEALQNTEDSDD